MAAGKAVEMGYERVYWYRDGLEGWRNAQHYIVSADPTYRNRKLPVPIAPQELQDKIAKGDDLIIVDIRGEKSRQTMGVVEANEIFCPLYRFEACYKELPFDKLLVILDIKAKQAPAALRFLLEKNFYFNKISYLDGGTSAWQAAGLPLKK